MERRETDKTTRPGDAEGAPEIEITPEMIEAGERELCRYDDAFEGTDEAVVKIYKAMVAASKKRVPHDVEAGE